MLRGAAAASASASVASAASVSATGAGDSTFSGTVSLSSATVSLSASLSLSTSVSLVDSETMETGERDSVSGLDSASEVDVGLAFSADIGNVSDDVPVADELDASDGELAACAFSAEMTLSVVLGLEVESAKVDEDDACSPKSTAGLASAVEMVDAGLDSDAVALVVLVLASNEPLGVVGSVSLELIVVLGLVFGSAESEVVPEADVAASASIEPRSALAALSFAPAPPAASAACTLPKDDAGHMQEHGQAWDGGVAAALSTTDVTEGRGVCGALVCCG